ncbi:MAG: DNA polymerase III subunit epsilon [Gammaproteobacteria bacterium]
MPLRQITLDTETTGLEVAHGHRIIEIGAVELVNRRITGRVFHHYLQPDRKIDAGAQAVHGISAEFLADKPRFSEIVAPLLEFIQGAEVISHNAPFDTGFLDYELALLGRKFGRIADHSTISDTLALARRLHPGQRNSLDALCKRYGIDNSRRELHGALLDARLLADLYLAMTGGQVGLSLEPEALPAAARATSMRQTRSTRAVLPVVRANHDERAAHDRYLQVLQKSSGGQCLWLASQEKNGAP